MTVESDVQQSGEEHAASASIDGHGGVLAKTARFAVRHHRLVIALSLGAAAILYFGILTRGAFNLAHKTAAPLAFNSMLQHLLAGRFDVDPDTIGHEGFLVQGKVYSYFGIVPALFRVIFLPFVDLSRTNLTTISCVVADLIAVCAQLALIFRIVRRSGDAFATKLILPLWIATLFSGPQFMFLRPSIYQEPVFWSLAFSYWFIYLVVDVVLLGRRLTVAVTTAMAVLAGLTLLTRVSTAVALYGALGLLLLHYLVTQGSERTSWVDRIRGAVGPIVLPTLTLVAFAGIAGYVNYERFGNPLTFLDLHYQIVSLVDDPQRLARVDRYGAFNLARIGYSLLYYFVPIWMLRRPDGLLLFPEFRHRYYDMIELPPSSFLLSDPLILALGVLFVMGLLSARWRGGRANRILLISLSAAFALSAAIELCAISLAFRYRGDFYPLFVFFGMAGLWWVVSLPEGTKGARLMERAAWPLAILGMLTSTLCLGLYFLSPFGDGEQCVRPGWINCYEARVKPQPSTDEMREGPQTQEP